MTEKELIEQQNSNGGDVFYLLKVGMFYHAYDNGAFALAGLMNYSVRRKRRKGLGEIFVSGFPLQSMSKVMKKIEDENGTIKMIDDGLYVFSGIDFSTDCDVIEETEHAKEIDYKENKLLHDIIREIDAFEIGNSTPIDALLFIREIQTKIRNGKIV